MNYNSILTRLYFLLIYADGEMNEREVAMAKRMIKAEAMREDDFQTEIMLMKTRDREAIYTESINALKMLDQDKQVRIVAWLCVMANSDGFMDRTEWQLIYKIYHKELGLPLHDIFTVQKELNVQVWKQTYLSI